MITVAVTGGMGSGKSTICSAFRSLRVPVLSADELSKKIADTVPAVRKKIVSLLGTGAYSRSGKLDRAYVASRIFASPPVRRKLESILHPIVLKRVKAWFAGQKKNGKNIAVVEAALVYESGLDRLVDLVLVVDAPKEVRVRRLQKRDGFTKQDIRRRMRAQMDDAERRQRADVVIRNAGRQSSLRRRARFFIDVLRKISP